MDILFKFISIKSDEIEFDSKSTNAIVKTVDSHLSLKSM